MEAKAVATRVTRDHHKEAEAERMMSSVRRNKLMLRSKL